METRHEGEGDLLEQPSGEKGLSEAPKPEGILEEGNRHWWQRRRQSFDDAKVAEREREAIIESARRKTEVILASTETDEDPVALAQEHEQLAREAYREMYETTEPKKLLGEALELSNTIQSDLHRDFAKIVVARGYGSVGEVAEAENLLKGLSPTMRILGLEQLAKATGFEVYVHQAAKEAVGLPGRERGFAYDVLKDDLEAGDDKALKKLKRSREWRSMPVQKYAALEQFGYFADEESFLPAKGDVYAAVRMARITGDKNYIDEAYPAEGPTSPYNWHLDIMRMVADAYVELGAFDKAARVIELGIEGGEKMIASGEADNTYIVERARDVLKEIQQAREEAVGKGKKPVTNLNDFKTAAEQVMDIKELNEMKRALVALPEYRQDGARVILVRQLERMALKAAA